MSQAIAYFIYGVPILNSHDDRSAAQEQLVEDRPSGVIAKYSGNGSWDTSAAFGVQLSSLQEGNHHQELGGLRLHATDDEVLEYQSLYASLDAEYKAALEGLGEPRVFILWGSS